MEKFHHNPAVPPNRDVAQRIFLLSENRVRVVYHLEPNRITSSSREFVTPPRGGEQAYNLTFDPEATTGYQVDPYAAEPKSRHLFEQLERLVAAQENSIAQARASEAETAAILASRVEEEASPALSVSVYDVARNQKAFQQREEEEEQRRLEERMQREKEMDYLAPFLSRVSNPDLLDKSQMKEVADVSTTTTAHSTQHTAHGTQHTAHSTQHTAHSTQHTAHGTRHTAHGTRHTAHSTRHTAHSTQHTAHGTQHTAHSTQHMAHSTQHTAHSTQSTILYTHMAHYKYTHTHTTHSYHTAV